VEAGAYPREYVATQQLRGRLTRDRPSPSTRLCGTHPHAARLSALLIAPAWIVRRLIAD